MRNTLLLLGLLYSLTGVAQGVKALDLPTKIEEVTVFIDGAQVTRAGSLKLPAGKSILTVKGLSPYIDEKSVQVKSPGNFTMLSVNHRLNYPDELKKNSQLDSLERAIEEAEEAIQFRSTRLEILRQRQTLLDENKVLSGTNSSLSLTQLRQALQLYDEELTKIKDGELRIESELRELRKTKEALQKQLATVSQEHLAPAGEITIEIDSKATTQARFSVSYLVSNAGWYPKYDVRVANVNEPIQLDYKAEVYQHTGVEWEQVQLKFSNGDPNKSGVAPELRTWFLNYPRHTVYQNLSAYDARVGAVTGRITDDFGEPLPGVNVLVKGTTVGTSTDMDGIYELTLPNNAQTLIFSYVGFDTQEQAINNTRMDVVLTGMMELQEVVVTGSSSKLRRMARGFEDREDASFATGPSTTTIENQTTVEFEVIEPYTIKSSGDKKSIKLKVYEIDAIYEYAAVPKLDRDAFLIAKIINWDQYSLLEGEANLYFEGGYVGRTILDARSLSDTLDISLGRDKSVVIGREKRQEYAKRKTIGSNITESRGFELLVRNKKSVPIMLTLHDQIPVTANSEISVEVQTLSGGTIDERTGIVEWKLALAPNEQIDLSLRYEVKYPRRERVLLE